MKDLKASEKQKMARAKWIKLIILSSQNSQYITSLSLFLVLHHLMSIRHKAHTSGSSNSFSNQVLISFRESRFCSRLDLTYLAAECRQKR